MERMHNERMPIEIATATMEGKEEEEDHVEDGETRFRIS
jgi:hypothetical protein